MASADVEDISILNLTVCDIAVIIDFKPATGIQNNPVSKLHVVLGKLLTNLTSSDNNAMLAPELLCPANVSSLVSAVLCLSAVGGIAYTGNGSNETNYMRLSFGYQENSEFSLKIERLLC
jgi:hypothetical protein